MAKKVTKKRGAKKTSSISILHFITLIGQAVLFPIRLVFLLLARVFTASKLALVHIYTELKKKITLVIQKVQKTQKSLKKSVRKLQKKIVLPPVSKYLIPVIIGITLGCMLFYLLFTMPKVESINDFSLPSAILIYDRHNVLLYSAYTDIYRIPVKIEQLPQTLIDATISAEDKHFYTHHGFDLFAMGRALVHNTYSKTLQGGSTITQQLAKNLYLTGATIPK